MKPLILASTSPYRKALLSRLGLPFTVEAPNVDESEHHRKRARPKIIAEGLALEKARVVLERHPGAVVIGADQVGSINHALLTKPGDKAAALQQLRLLAGRTHELYTAVVIMDSERVLPHTEVTKLTMDRLTEEMLERYIERDNPLDCAGSYKIESLGVALFEKVEGSDVTAIEGLPLMAVSRLLREIGYQVP